MSTNPLERPLLSVVIPTRNREHYARAAIESVLAIGDERLELVVQDNSDSTELDSWVRDRISDPRLRYGRTAEPLSFVGNFDRAATLSTGEYVCFIGDDDGVNPEILEAAEWARMCGLDALSTRPSVHYLWPGAALPATLFTASTDGVLTIARFASQIRYVDPEVEMSALMRNGGLYYLETDLPKLYHGLVHRRCLAAIRQRTGAFFGGLSPDTFASLSVSCVAKSVAVTDYPLTIPGSCRESGSIIEGALKRHSKRLEDAPHLRHRGEYAWSPLVPRVYTVETLWVDSSLAALRAMGREDVARLLDVPKLAAQTLWANRGIGRAVFEGLLMALRKQGKTRSAGVTRFVLNLLCLACRFGLQVARRLWRRAQSLVGVRHVQRIAGIRDMGEASRELARYLTDSGKSFTALKGAPSGAANSTGKP